MKKTNNINIFKSQEDNTENEEELDFSTEDLFNQIGFNYNDRLDSRRIYLFGEINKESILNVIYQIQMYEQKSNEDITLIINSDGGYINDCFALIDIMDSSKCDIGVVVLGIAASAACLIASNGTQGKRVAGKNSEFMFHEVTGFPYEIKKSDLEYIKKETVKHQKKFSQIFARNTGQAIRTIEKIFYGQKDRYMNSSEAKQFGIVDKILIQRKREKIVKKTKSQKNGAKND